MRAYIKKFWTTLLGGFVFGVALAILLGIPWRFVLSLAIFVFILNTIIEQAKGYSAVTNLANKVLTFSMGVVIFVGLRAIAGYLLDQPADQAYKDLTSGNGIMGITTRGITTNIVFEILFLIPGVAIAYLVVKEGRFWKTALVMICSVLLCWVAWTIKQRAHAEAMKRQSQALVSLSARSLNNKALVNEAAAATSFGIAKEHVRVFYQWNAGTTNMVHNPAITNRLQAGDRVLQLYPNNQPVVFEGQAFIEVVLSNTNCSFVGGIKTWVEAWRFNWVDGRNSVTTQTGSQTKTESKTKLTLKKGDKFTYKLGLNEATPWIEVPKGIVFNISERNFRVFYSNGHPPIDVGEKDVIFPDVSPTIIRVGSLVPDNNIEITGM